MSFSNVIRSAIFCRMSSSQSLCCCCIVECVAEKFRKWFAGDGVSKAVETHLACEPGGGGGVHTRT